MSEDIWNNEGDTDLAYDRMRDKQAMQGRTNLVGSEPPSCPSCGGPSKTLSAPVGRASTYKCHHCNNVHTSDAGRMG